MNCAKEGIDDGPPSEGWKIFAEGDEADNVPLWKVLAQFRSDDLDEGLSMNAAIIDQAKSSPLRFYNLAFIISFGFGFLSIIFLIRTSLSRAIRTATDASSATSHSLRWQPRWRRTLGGRHINTA